MATPLLDVSHLTVSYSSPSGPVGAVSDVSFQVACGETLALVGETGCGKSTVALSLLGLLNRGGKRESGSILFDGRDLASMEGEQWRSIRGRKIGFVFQDARGALNPVLTVGEHLLETLRAHGRLSRPAARQAALRLLAEVGIPDPEYSMHRYPLEFSGGMCQRVGIALAICNRPRLLIADEPTSALDTTLQAQVLSLLLEMKRRHDLALLLISHDLAMVSDFAERVLVLYFGRVVEHGPAKRVFSNPAHPYTRGLLRSQPSLHHHRDHEPLASIPGMPPSQGQRLSGCPFAPRCTFAEPVCATALPEPQEMTEGHWAACFKAGGRDFGAAT